MSQKPSIAVNTRLLLSNKLGGIGWFTYETLKYITQNHPEYHFYFLFDRKYSEEFIFSDNITPVIVHPQARHPILFYLWFEHAIPKVLKRLEPDLFLSPDGYLSLKSQVKSLAVIHDINFHHYPEDFPFMVRKYYNYFFPQFAKKANRIATVSECSKLDLIDSYRIIDDKVDIVYNGVNKLYQSSELIDVEERFAFKNQAYFLFVSTLLPRKNIVNLLKGFDHFKVHKSSDIQLVMVGNRKWWTSEMEEAFSGMKHQDCVHFVPYTKPKELKALYQNALAFTFVPYFEGFGIPNIEAMSCNTPVLTANVSATKEITEGAALLVDPFDIEAISEGMVKIAFDEDIRADLVEKGQKRAEKFTWEKTSIALWESIQKTINQ